jgi:hypothetical protein
MNKLQYEKSDEARGSFLKEPVHLALFVSCMVVSVDLAVLAVFNTQSSPVSKLWWSVNFPSVPVIVICAWIYLPPWDSPYSKCWDIIVITLSVLFSALAWGASAYFFSRWVMSTKGCRH